MNRNGIKKWMIDSGITSAQIAREAKVSKALVSMVLSGMRKNIVIMTLLKGHGCPAEYLEPRKVGRKKAA